MLRRGSAEPGRACESWYGQAHVTARSGSTVVFVATGPWGAAGADHRRAQARRADLFTVLEGRATLSTDTRWGAFVTVLLIIAAAGGLAAQMTNWSAAVTVGTWTFESTTYKGYSIVGSHGQLSDRDFEYNGTTYTIVHLYETDDETHGDAVALGIAPPIPERPPLVFEVDGYGPLELPDANHIIPLDREEFGSGSLYVWTMINWTWPVGDTVRVRLTDAPEEPEPTPAVPALGLVLLTALLAGSHLRRRWGR